MTGQTAMPSASLAQLPPERVLPEAYRLTEPLSPHRAAELDGIQIDPARLSARSRSAGGGRRGRRAGADHPQHALCRSLCLVEPAGHRRGAHGLGTINHSLLTVEALRARGVPIHGIAFVGAANDDNEQTIAAMGKVRRLGRLDPLDPLTPETLAAAFARGFALEDFA
jgi:dethiobiotin synthetase